jgi:hypothetical protein
LPDSSADNATFTVAGVDYTGQWVKLELPESERVRVKSIVIASNLGGGTDDRRPHEGVFLGSNDDTNWELISKFDLDSLGYVNYASDGLDSRATIDGITNTSYYKYLMIVVTKIATTNLYGVMQINELEYYGIPEYDPEADGTDVIVRSVPNVPNTDWLEVYYDAKNYSGSGDVQDETTNNRDGSLRGDTSLSSADGIHKFDFDGSGDYIESLNITSIVGDQPLSSSLWVKFTSWTNANYDFIFSLGDRTVSGDGTEYSLTVNHSSNRVYIGTNGSGGTVLSEFTLYLERWYHFATTYDGVKNYLYIDGGTFSRSEILSGSMNFPASGCDLVLGADTASSRAQFMNGSIANFRLFNRALTGDEVWQLYAYQKEYFGHGNLDMTLKGGRLGIGTTEPGAVLDVRGSIMSSGYILQKNFVCCRWINGGDKSVATSEKIPFDGIVYDPNNLWSTVSDAFVAPVTGVYLVHVNLVTDSTTSSDGNHELYVNDSILTPRHRGLGTVTGANAARTANCHYIIPLQAGDELSIRSTSATVWYGSTTHAHSHVSIHLISGV